MVTTLGAAFAAAAVAVVAESGFLMTTFCAAAGDPPVEVGWSRREGTPAPAPPPMTAPATRPATPIPPRRVPAPAPSRAAPTRQRPVRGVGAGCTSVSVAPAGAPNG